MPLRDFSRSGSNGFLLFRRKSAKKFRRLLHDRRRHADRNLAYRQRLTDGNGTNLQPYWAKDNRVYFISDRGGVDAVWSVKAPTGGHLMAEQGDTNKRDAAASTDVGVVGN